MLSQIVGLPHLVPQPLGVLQPHLTSIPQPRQTLFILAPLQPSVITGVPPAWLNGSAGVPEVPATISMSEVLMDSYSSFRICILLPPSATVT